MENILNNYYDYDFEHWIDNKCHCFWVFVFVLFCFIFVAIVKQKKYLLKIDQSFWSIISSREWWIYMKICELSMFKSLLSAQLNEDTTFWGHSLKVEPFKTSH